MQPVSGHIYFRTIDPLGKDSLAKIAQRIAPATRVLDVGCGPGVLGEKLAADKGCTVDGVEGNPDAAALAAPKMRRVVVADLESEPLAPHFGGERYDYIVCADVLEHLRRPEALLAQLTALLAPSGRILISIPNVGYAGLVGALINGEFRYRDEGLLDATHLRFFTRASLLRWLAKCQLQVTHSDTVTIPISESEFAGDGVESLPPAVLRTLLGQADALTYQLIVEVVPAGSSTLAAPERPSTAAAFTYVAQLYYRADGPFDAAHSCTVHGAMAVDRQRLRFTIPPSSAEWVALRLDPTNRPGYLRLYTMALFTANEDCVWRWDPAQQPFERSRSDQLQVVQDGEREGLLLVAQGDDPWFELPLAGAPLAALRGGGTLEVELSWPQSHDSFALLRQLFGRDGKPARATELSRLHDELRALRLENEDLQRQLRGERELVAHINRSLTFRLARPFHGIANRLRKQK